MGIYDRDYGRSDDESYDSYERTGIRLGGPRTLTTNLILLMVSVYVVQLLTRADGRVGGGFTEFFSLHADVWRRPWMFFQFLTYGFLHDPTEILHIVFNLLVFWFFGRVVEMRYGRREYLAFFLVAIVFAGIVWCVGENLIEGGRPSVMLGASGGLAAVLLLFALNFPHQVIYIWGVLPIPAWLFAALFVGQDMYGAVNRSGNVAYSAHLGGALFAIIYFRGRWRISDWLPSGVAMPRLRRRPKLKVHHPDNATEMQLDEILRKIQEQGQESLTREERRFLERTSREYQQRRN